MIVILFSIQFNLFFNVGCSVYAGKAWRVVCYYKDWRGERVRHEKRGFATKHEAVEYEHNFLAKQTKDINM
ncbi:MAG: Arm DNA-binding domain-containing protein [Saccharofermentans sp.]|nr:Arm DNA-binding domain-containing protein [Saccharofermentans sp.]